MSKEYDILDIVKKNYLHVIKRNHFRTKKLLTIIDTIKKGYTDIESLYQHFGDKVVKPHIIKVVKPHIIKDNDLY